MWSIFLKIYLSTFKLQLDRVLANGENGDKFILQIIYSSNLIYAPLAQLDRALVYGKSGQYKRYWILHKIQKIIRIDHPAYSVSPYPTLKKVTQKSPAQEFL